MVAQRMYRSDGLLGAREYGLTPPRRARVIFDMGLGLCYESDISTYQVGLELIWSGFGARLTRRPLAS